MITLFAIGDREKVEWVRQYAAVANFDCSLISSLAELPSTYVSQGTVYLDSLEGVSFSDLGNLVRKGFHLFLNTPFDLSINELNNLALLAEEAGVYVIPRLPLELKLPLAVGITPLVGSVSLETDAIPEREAWRVNCMSAISLALSILPFSVKRIRCVADSKQPNAPIFMGCHLEFENTSLISISICSGSVRNSLLAQFLDSSGSYKYLSGAQEFGGVSIKTKEDQFDQLIELCSSPTQRFSVVGLDTIAQIMRIYAEMKGHFVSA